MVTVVHVAVCIPQIQMVCDIILWWSSKAKQMLLIVTQAHLQQA